MKLKNKCKAFINNLKQLDLKNSSIKVKLPFYLLIFVMTTLVLLWLVEVILFENIYTYVKQDSLTRAGNLIVKEVDKKHADKLIEKISREIDVCVSVTDEFGHSVYSGINNRDCNTKISLDDFMNRIHDAQSHDGIYVDEFYKEEPVFDINASDPSSIKFKQSIRVVKQISYTGIVHTKDKTYIVMLDARLTPLDSTVDLIRKILIFVTVVLSLFALWLGWLLSRQITKPLLEISEQAQQLANGDYSQFKTVNGYREVQNLSQTLKQAAEDLQQVEKLRNELIANISHDLRTPLTMISGYAEMMRDLPGENTPENIQIILDETTHLSRLVSDVLDLSKLRSGSNELQLKTYCITDSIQSVIERLQALTNQEGYQITFDYHDKIYVEADELQISQVIYNLCTNAINYTGDDKLVRIVQTNHENNVRIEIIDTGQGISEDEIDKIWERYYRTNSNHTRAKVGSGLGLSIVGRILEHHHAKYGVNSKQNIGTTFWFELPIKDMS